MTIFGMAKSAHVHRSHQAAIQTFRIHNRGIYVCVFGDLQF